MPVHGIDDGNNKHAVYTAEEVLAILQQAIDSGSLQGIDPDKNPIVAAIRESHNNSNLTFWSGTEDEFNALTDITTELVGARIGSDGKLYVLTGDTTLSDTVEAARQAALEATEGMKREVISVTLLANAWSDTAPYTQTVAVPGMTADKDFLAPFVAPTGNEADDLAAQVALSCISGGTTDTDSMTFYCYDEKPTTTITVFMVDKGTKIEPGDYPIASTSQIGMVKVGDGLNVDQDGKMSVAAYEVATYSFDNVAAMVAYNLAEGDTAITAGYYAINDGGAGTYKIVSSGASANGGSIIELSNGLKARLIVNNGAINVKQFGAKAEEGEDATTYIQTALNSGYNVVIPEGTFYISDTLVVNTQGISVKGCGKNSVIRLIEGSAVTGNAIIKTTTSKVTISDLTIRGSMEDSDTELTAGLLVDNGSDSCIFENIDLFRIKGNFLRTYFHTYDCQFINITGQYASLNGCIIGSTDNFFNKCIFYMVNLHGFLVYRGNNLFNQCKTYFTGLANRGVAEEDRVQTGCGYYVCSGVEGSAHTNRFVNCEAQECGWHGWYIQGCTGTQAVDCQADTNGVYLHNSAGFVIYQSYYSKINGVVTNKQGIGGIDAPKNGQHDYGVIVDGEYNDINVNVTLIKPSSGSSYTSTKFFKKIADIEYRSSNSAIINGFNYFINKFSQEMIEDTDGDGVANGFTFDKFGNHVEGEAVIDINERCQKLTFTDTSTASSGNNIRLIKRIDVQSGYTKFSMAMLRKEILTNLTDASLSVRFRCYDAGDNKIYENSRNVSEFVYEDNPNHRLSWTPFYYRWNIAEDTAYITFEIVEILETVGTLSGACIKDFSYILS